MPVLIHRRGLAVACWALAASGLCYSAARAADLPTQKLLPASIAVKVAESDRNLIDGSDETLQLLAVCSTALEQFKKKKI